VIGGVRASAVRLLAVVLLGTAAMPARGLAQTPGRPASERILVMPFDNPRRDSAIFWLGEASSVLLADDLNAAGLNAITRPERQRAFDRLQIPTAAALTDATVIRIAELVGASQVVIGSLQLDNGVLVVRARSLAVDAGKVQSDVTERGPVPDLFAIFDRLAKRSVVPAYAAAAPPDRPPIAAFENYIKGLLAETPATAVNYLSAALMLDPGYDRARLALWDVYADDGDHARALAAVSAVPATSPRSRRARFLAGVSQLYLKKYDDAFATYEALVDAQATPTILNNLGVVQLRRGAAAPGGTPTYYFDRAAKADPGDPDYFFNLGYAYWQGRDYPAAMYWLREAVRRNPADGDAHFVLGAALAATGDQAQAARERELAKRLSSTYENWEKRPAAEQVPRDLERVKNDEVELPHASLIETRIADTGQRDQEELARFYLGRGRRLFDRGNDRDAVAELDRAVYLSPYLAGAHLLLGRIHLRNGRLPEAIGALEISLWSAESAEAHAVLADAYRQSKKPDQARTEAERALALDPKSEDARQVLDMLKSP
jgi:tetratricopeptide (TPR) repeat protein